MQLSRKGGDIVIYIINVYVFILLQGLSHVYMQMMQKCVQQALKHQTSQQKTRPKTDKTLSVDGCVILQRNVQHFHNIQRDSDQMASS